MAPLNWKTLHGRYQPYAKAINGTLKVIAHGVECHINYKPMLDSEVFAHFITLDGTFTLGGVRITGTAKSLNEYLLFFVKVITTKYMFFTVSHHYRPFIKPGKLSKFSKSTDLVDVKYWSKGELFDTSMLKDRSLVTQGRLKYHLVQVFPSRHLGLNCNLQAKLKRVFYKKARVVVTHKSMHTGETFQTA